MHDAPTPPDPFATAAAQSKSNIATATAQQGMNMVNQNNAKGSLNYSQTGTNPDGTPSYTANTTLSQPMQGIFDKSTALTSSLLGGSAGGALSGKPLDLSYNGTTAALDKLNAARLDPQWAHNTDMQESKLAAQGLTPGTPAYDRSMAVFNQGKNDAYNSANLADYGLSSSNAAAEYAAPLATLGSVYGVGNSAGSPTFANTPQSNVAGTNLAGLVEQNYQQQSQNANAQNGQMAGLLGAGLGAAGTAIGGPVGGAAGGWLGKAMGGLFGSNSGTTPARAGSAAGALGGY